MIPEKSYRVYGNLVEDKTAIGLFASLCTLLSFTWIMTKYQTNNGILPEIAVFYRFFPLSCIMFFVAKLLKQSLKISKKEFKILFIFAILCCNLHYILFYYSIIFMVSAISAVIFSFSIIFIALIKKFLNLSNDKLSPILTSGFLGIAGLIFIMHQKLYSYQNDLITGIMIAFIATFVYAAGSVFYEEKKLQIKLSYIASFAYVSLIGSLLGLCFALLHSLILQEPINFVPNINSAFVFSYLYLVFSGSSILIFMALIQRIGATKTAYSNLITPVMAVLVSSVYENYELTISTIFGILLVVISNYVALFLKKT